MGHAQMYGADAEFGGAGGDRTSDLERWLALVICQHFGVQPRQAVWPPQCLRQCFLRGKSRRLGGHGPLSLCCGENPPDETRPPFYRLGKSIDVADVDANPNDHEPGIMHADSVIMNRHLIIWVLLNSDGLGKIARLIDVVAFFSGKFAGEQLQRHSRH